MLTNKAKQDFEKWLHDGDTTPWVTFFESLPDTVKNAYYVEWLDLQGIYVTVKQYRKAFNAICNGIMVLSENEKLGYWFTTRNEATKAAILTANKIYNEKY